MKHLYEETIQKLCHLECEKEDLHKLLHDHKIESSRKIAALETMLIEVHANYFHTRTVE